MPNKYKFVFLVLLLTGIFFLLAFFLSNPNIALFNTKGIIASKERDLIITAVSLGLAVIIPVFVLTFFIVSKYREGNKSENYSSEWELNPKLQALWWAIPTVVILILAVINWNSTHDLDPFKPIEASVKPVTIQVVALRWKWLFIYPDQNIATVNFVQFPKQTPVNFELTAEAPMSSFWIPQLGGQIYAMSGMGTHLHLMADNPGDFAGSAAEINGSGFSGMKFTARASSQTDFDTWVQQVKESPKTLDLSEYNNLVAASENNPTAFYSSAQDNLYNQIIMRYTMPTGGSMNMQHLEY